MPESIQSLLDALPEGVIQMRAGLVLASNEKARQYLPPLEVGAPLPISIFLPQPGGTEEGVFVFDSVAYSYTCKASKEEQILLFRPDSRSALENWQLDGTLRQLRELLGELLAEVGPAAVPGGAVSAGAFGKTFHQLFRLVNNLDFIRRMTAAEPPPFHPVTTDLDNLCRNTVRQAGELLQEAGIRLEYRYMEQRSGLFISGDPELLQRLLLGLISNAAQAAEEGRICVSLMRGEDQIFILVANAGPAPDDRHLSALLQGGPAKGLPLPGQGAGLGIPIARRIVRLHNGTLLPYQFGAVHGVLVSLPVTPLDSRLSLRTPLPIQMDGGLDPILVELSDVLPASIFSTEPLD